MHAVVLADRTAIYIHNDRLLASSCRPSVRLSVTLCIVVLRVGVQGQTLHQRVPIAGKFLCPFTHLCSSMYCLDTNASEK